MSERKYQAPPWGAAPTADFFLEILKNGTIAGTVDLGKKDHYLFGRQADIVDVALEHETISRQHAVIQFRDDGQMLVFDLGSVHGTFVNKQPVTPKVYQRLNVGDMIRFGASSRMYIVNGPDELRPAEHDSENMQKYRETLKMKSVKAAASQEEGISWGMDEDAVPVEEPDDEADEDDIPFDELPDYLKNDPRYRDKYDADGRPKKVALKHVHEKDAKLVEKLRQKEKKIENLEGEIHRIRAKDNAQGGLTEGQQNAIQRNEQQIEKLRDEIDELQHEIETKGQQRDQTARRENGDGQPRRLKIVHEDETDEFYDRTALNADESNWRIRKKRQRHAGKPAEAVNEALPTNFKSLDSRQKALEAQAQEIQLRIQNIVQEPSAAMAAAGEGDGDELDLFMASNKAKDNQQELAALRKRLQEIEKELSTVSKLAEFVKPALPDLLPSLGPQSHEAANADTSKDAAEPPKPPAAVERITAVRPSPVTTEPFIPEEESDDEEDKSTSEHDNPEVAAATSSEPSAAAVLPQRSEQQPETAAEKQPLPKRKVYGAAMPQRNQRPKVEGTSKFDDAFLEGGDAAWVPPKNQTGDGRTALNDKLGY